MSARPEPRNAASLVIVDQAGSLPRVLLGKRRLTQAFAPGKFVFPGGSLDAADAEYPGTERLAESDRLALAHDPGAGSDHIPPEAFALCAIRETFEETGLVLGAPGSQAAAGVPAAWRAFLGLGVRPNLTALAFIARAITPPARPRRFDARFFLSDATAISHRLDANDGEFEAIDWVDFATARGLDLHGMTREIVIETERLLSMPAAVRRAQPVPYFHQGSEGWQRSHIGRPESISGA